MLLYLPIIINTVEWYVSYLIQDQLNTVVEHLPICGEHLLSSPSWNLISWSSQYIKFVIINIRENKSIEFNSLQSLVSSVKLCHCKQCWQRLHMMCELHYSSLLLLVYCYGDLSKLSHEPELKGTCNHSVENALTSPQFPITIQDRIL